MYMLRRLSDVRVNLLPKLVDSRFQRELLRNSVGILGLFSLWDCFSEHSPHFQAIIGLKPIWRS
jgi:hypothetical protein